VTTGLGGAGMRKRVGVTSDLLQSIAPDCAARWLRVFYSMDSIDTCHSELRTMAATLALPRWHDICKKANEGQM